MLCMANIMEMNIPTFKLDCVCKPESGGVLRKVEARGFCAAREASLTRPTCRMGGLLTANINQAHRAALGRVLPR